MMVHKFIIVFNLHQHNVLSSVVKNKKIEIVFLFENVKFWVCITFMPMNILHIYLSPLVKSIRRPLPPPPPPPL